MLTPYSLLLLLTASLLAGPSHAASPAPAAKATQSFAAGPRLVCLAGTILTASGRPCPGVCVFPVSNPRLIAVTDARGTFQLQVPVVATLRLQAEYVGLGSVRVEVDTLHPQPIHLVLGR